MTEPIENNNNCCNIIDKIDDFWEEHKYRISSKLSIVLGVLSGVGSALIGAKIIILGSVVTGIVSTGVFFAGIALSKYENQNKTLKKDNESLKQELTKRLTLYDNFKFPISNPNLTPISDISEASTNTYYEKVVVLNLNN